MVDLSILTSLNRNGMLNIDMLNMDIIYRRWVNGLNWAVCLMNNRILYASKNEIVIGLIVRELHGSTQYFWDSSVGVKYPFNFIDMGVLSDHISGRNGLHRYGTYNSCTKLLSQIVIDLFRRRNAISIYNSIHWSPG